MADFNSKYTGEQVEALLDIVSQGGVGGGGGGGITVETDPIFSASPAASITEEKKAEWDDKVDKEEGKQLSTEDFTTALKTKLEGLSNYDDAEIQNAVSSLQTQLNTLVSGNASDAINSFNEIIAFLDGVKDSEDLESIIASIEQQIAGKMDKVTLAAVATSGSYNDLTNKPTIPAAVTESTVSGWGFTKNTGTITGVSANGTSVATSGVANIPAASTSAYGVTKLSSATNSTSTTLAATASAVKTAYDLANGRQPKLVSGSNIKTINGTSILGSGNIEISGGSKTYVFDWGEGNVYSGTISAEEFAEMLAADTIIVNKLQGMLTQEADTILKVGTSQCCFIIHAYTSGNIEGIYFEFNDNGSSGASWTATVMSQEVPTKTSQLTNDSKFVQSTNLKTINGESIVGSGDITISGGGSSGGSGAYPVEVVSIANLEQLHPNTYYIINDMTTLDTLHITLNEPTDNSIVNEYIFEFYVGDAIFGSASLTLPDTIKFANDVYPDLKGDYTYVISIVNNLAVFAEFVGL